MARKERRGSIQVPKGYVPVLVGHGMERFLVRAEHLMHPGLVLLLEMAYQEFGYQQEGILTIPCDAQRFRDVLQAVSKTSASSSVMGCITG